MKRKPEETKGNGTISKLDVHSETYEKVIMKYEAATGMSSDEDDSLKIDGIELQILYEIDLLMARKFCV